MSRVITFSQTFPSYHPRKGQKTYFVTKIIASLSGCIDETLYEDGSEFNLISLAPKHHTIRAGHRWKVGDKFSPRVWSDAPYRSKQIQFTANEIEIKKVWNFSIHAARFFINDNPISMWKGNFFSDLAKNDGLTADELKEWFMYPKPFEGQIICWNENIDY